MQNIVKERLPKFTKEEVKMVKGSIDFLGINQYTAFYMYDPHQPKPKVTGYQTDWNVGFACRPSLFSYFLLKSCCRYYSDFWAFFLLLNHFSLCHTADERHGVPIGPRVIYPSFHWSYFLLCIAWFKGRRLGLISIFYTFEWFYTCKNLTNYTKLWPRMMNQLMRTSTLKLNGSSMDGAF